MEEKIKKMVASRRFRMKTKNFFYRVNPESVLSELTSINHDEWLQFFLNFFHDLRNDDIANTKTMIAGKIISESHNFRELRSKAGKASVKQKATYVEHMLKDVQPVAVAVAVSSISTKKEYAFNVSFSEEEYKKLSIEHGEPFVKKCIEKLSGYKESKGKVYKSDAGAMRTWVIDEVKKTWRTNTEVIY